MAGLVVAQWRKLRAAVEVHQATNDEQQVLHLIEYVTARFGGPLLDAATLDDLDDALDAVIGSPEALYSTRLLARHSTLIQGSEVIPAARLADVVSENLGMAQGRLITDSQRLMDAWMDAQRQVSAMIVDQISTDAREALEFYLLSPELPAEIARCVYHSIRAGFCSIAIARAVMTGASVEPWLARALIERLVSSVREHLRMLASLPGITVDPAIVPLAERFDLGAIAARHQRARVVSRLSYEATRTRLGL